MHFLMDFLKVKCKGLFAFVSSVPGTGLGTEEAVSNCLLHCLDYTGNGGSSGRPCSTMTMFSFPWHAPLLCLPSCPHHPLHHKTTKQQGSGGRRCGSADTLKDPGSVCFCLEKLDNSFNLFILKTLKDNTNS